MPCVIASDEGSTISMILLQQRGARSSQSSPNTTIFSSPRGHCEQRSGNTSPRRRYELLHSWFLLLPTLREVPYKLCGTSSGLLSTAPHLSPYARHGVLPPRVRWSVMLGRTWQSRTRMSCSSRFLINPCHHGGHMALLVQVTVHDE